MKLSCFPLLFTAIDLTFFCPTNPIPVYLRLHIFDTCVLAVSGAVRLRNGASKLFYKDMDIYTLFKIMSCLCFSSGTYACVLRYALAHASLHSARVPSAFKPLYPYEIRSLLSETDYLYFSISFTANIQMKRLDISRPYTYLS